jgi:hypothetical protein
VSDRLVSVITFGLDIVFNFGFGALIHVDFDPDERLELSIESVRHEFEVAIGRSELNDSFTLEFVHVDTLVEFEVVHFNGS